MFKIVDKHYKAKKKVFLLYCVQHTKLRDRRISISAGNWFKTSIRFRFVSMINWQQVLVSTVVVYGKEKYKLASPIIDPALIMADAFAGFSLDMT